MGYDGQPFKWNYIAVTVKLRLRSHLEADYWFTITLAMYNTIVYPSCGVTEASGPPQNLWRWRLGSFSEGIDIYLVFIKSDVKPPLARFQLEFNISAMRNWVGNRGMYDI